MVYSPLPRKARAHPHSLIEKKMRQKTDRISRIILLVLTSTICLVTTVYIFFSGAILIGFVSILTIPLLIILFKLEKELEELELEEF